MYCGAMSGLLKKKMKNLGKPALLRWQMSDSQYSRGSAVTDVSDSVQHSLLYRKFKSGDANDASPAVHFQDAAPQDELKDDGSPCSHNTLISDRKVFKINFYHQPMMREEQLYKLVLHQVLYKPRKRKMMLSTSTRMQKMKSSILKLRRTQEG